LKGDKEGKEAGHCRVDVGGSKARIASKVGGLCIANVAPVEGVEEKQNGEEGKEEGIEFADGSAGNDGVWRG
jgi:hypothetical protein